MPDAPQVAKNGRETPADFFLVGGMNSYVDPMFIPERGYQSGVNVLNRGGVVQCRPGFNIRLVLPPGKPQGLKFFQPTGQRPYLVFVVDGLVYVSPYPFNGFRQLPGIKFRKGAKMVYWCDTEQAAQRSPDGSIQAIGNKRVLVMQDGGYTRAAYWDGATSTHSDPSPANLGIPIGGPMAWSGDRLWVASDSQLRASDIVNPLAFSENVYLADGKSFSTRYKIVAMAEWTSLKSAPLVVFTDRSAILFQSNIRDRSTWKTTTDFQRTFLDIGCAAPRSVINQYGLLWFYTYAGLTSIDGSSITNLSSQVRMRDVEMAASKSNLGATADMIAAGKQENFLFYSVPSGSSLNRHTWIMDHDAADLLNVDSNPAWASVWTGVQPVEWASGTINGQPRSYCLSVDRDGVSRIWEAFGDTQYDNGAPITWAVDTRGHGMAGLPLAQFANAEIHCVNLSGRTSLKAFYAGAHRGPWKSLATKQVNVGTGNIDAVTPYSASTVFYDGRPQSRVLKTQNGAISDGSTGSPELNARENYDYGFQLRVVGSGPGGVRGYRIFLDPVSEDNSGAVQTNEATPTTIMPDGVLVK